MAHRAYTAAKENKENEESKERGKGMTPTYIDILVLWLVFLAAYALIKTMIFQYQIEKIVKEIVIERRKEMK